jgi:hypothetical protein
MERAFARNTHESMPGRVREIQPDGNTRAGLLDRVSSKVSREEGLLQAHHPINPIGIARAAPKPRHLLQHLLMQLGLLVDQLKHKRVNHINH